MIPLGKAKIQETQCAMSENAVCTKSPNWFTVRSIPFESPRSIDDDNDVMSDDSIDGAGVGVKIDLGFKEWGEEDIAA